MVQPQALEDTPLYKPFCKPKEGNLGHKDSSNALMLISEEDQENDQLNDSKSTQYRNVDTSTEVWIPRVSQRDSYTVYHIISIFGGSSDGEETMTYEVDRRFSQFEHLLAYLREKFPFEVIPDLPKKRFFNNTNEQVIELRR